MFNIRCGERGESCEEQTGAIEQAIASRSSPHTAHKRKRQYGQRVTDDKLIFDVSILSPFSAASGDDYEAAVQSPKRKLIFDVSSAQRFALQQHPTGCADKIESLAQQIGAPACAPAPGLPALHPNYHPQSPDRWVGGLQRGSDSTFVPTPRLHIAHTRCRAPRRLSAARPSVGWVRKCSRPSA